MERKFILTAFGKDRPGIVADISRVIYDCGGNMEDSTMTRLGGEFVMMLLFSGPGDFFEENVLRELRRLETEKGISASFRPVSLMDAFTPEGLKIHTIRLEGMDQAGIVYAISSFLARHGINIQALDSTLRKSPETGTAIYAMRIRVQIPEDFPLAELDDGLHKLADELGVDIVRMEEI